MPGISITGAAGVCRMPGGGGGNGCLVCGIGGVDTTGWPVGNGGCVGSGGGPAGDVFGNVEINGILEIVVGGFETGGTGVSCGPFVVVYDDGSVDTGFGPIFSFSSSGSSPLTLCIW